MADFLPFFTQDKQRGWYLKPPLEAQATLTEVMCYDTKSKPFVFRTDLLKNLDFVT